MKKGWMLGAAMLMAGCAQPVKETVMEPVQKEETAKNSEALSYGEALAAAFKDNGYAVTDIDNEMYEYSFDATSNTGRVEASVGTHNVLAEYAHEAKQGTVEETDKDHEITTCLDKEDGTYDLIALDKKNEVLYEVDDVAEGDLEQMRSILSSVGF